MNEKDPEDHAALKLPEEDQSESSKTECKLEINRIIWQYGAPTVTLQEAEQLAVEFWGKVMRTWPS